MESTFEKIVRKSGRKPIACKCDACKQQCKRCPCLGTPADIEKLIDAGYGDKIKPTTWAAGILMGCTNQLVNMYQAELVPPSKNLTWIVAKEWLDDKNLPIVERIIQKMSKIEANG